MQKPSAFFFGPVLLTATLALTAFASGPQDGDEARPAIPELSDAEFRQWREGAADLREEQLRAPLGAALAEARGAKSRFAASPKQDAKELAAQLREAQLDVTELRVQLRLLQAQVGNLNRCLLAGATKEKTLREHARAVQATAKVQMEAMKALHEARAEGR